MKKLNLALAVVLAMCFLLPAQQAVAETHYVIVSPLRAKGPRPSGKVNLDRHFAAVDVAASILGNVEFVAYPYREAPVVYDLVPLSEDRFASSESTVSNLFEGLGGTPGLVRVTFSPANSNAMLRLYKGNKKLSLEVPAYAQAAGLGFAFPLGSIGERAVLYVGNPSGTTASVDLHYGAPANPVDRTDRVRSGMVISIPLEEAYTRVVLGSDMPVVVMLEVVEEGVVTRTYILPG